MSILLVSYIACHMRSEMETRRHIAMICDDVATLTKHGCRIAIFGVNSHMWLNHSPAFVLELQGRKALYAIVTLGESVAYVYM